MRIRELREAHGLKQIEIANQMGVCQASVSGWEAESVLPNARVLPRLAQVLGCTIQELFSEAEDRSA